MILNKPKKILIVLFLNSKYSKVIHLGTERNSDNRATQIFNPDLYFDPSETKLYFCRCAAWYKTEQLFLLFLHAKNQPNKKDLKLILVGPIPQPHEMNAELSSSLKKHTKDVFVWKISQMKH